MARAVIFVNGLLPESSNGYESVRRLFRPDDLFLAADGGTRHALALGLMPSVVIGDLDSLEEHDRRKLESANVDIQRHPRDKDETDLELALQYAVENGYHEILLVGALGRRLDQTLGNLALMSSPSLTGLDVRADDGVEEAFFTGGRCQVRGSPGDLVSLIAWGGEVTGVQTDGLRWTLRGETLYPDKTRGISNEMTEKLAHVAIATGLLLCVHRRV